MPELEMDVFEALNQPNILEDGILSSPMEGLCPPIQVVGSYYQTIASQAEESIGQHGDWNWLNDHARGEFMTAREALDNGKR